VEGSVRAGADAREVLFERAAALAGGAISRTEGASVIIAVGWISLGRVTLFCSDGVTVFRDDSGFRDAELSFSIDSLATTVLPHDGAVAVLSVGFWFGLSEWFETLTGATTRLRTAVDSLLGVARGSLDRRSLVCVCAAAKVETASKKASRTESLFILTLNSEFRRDSSARAPAAESLSNLPAKTAGFSKLINDERSRVSGKSWNL
jgi:hypothetical protein